ncbi:MAG TPA: hypothetical protein VHK28_00755, partial [Candidatus Limnocylindria bacterium]|nr:hypothetical protein [Candidatus Limnocylindria bacterium]
MPELPPRDQLELAAQVLTAILATWLGLTVTVRSPPSPATRAFGLISLLLVTWSVAIVVQRLSTVPAVDSAFNALEEVGAFLVVAATPHIAIAITAEGRWSLPQRINIWVAYGLAALIGIPSVINPGAEFAITPPHFELPGIPGEVFGWAWILIRMGMFASALAWI